MVPALDPSSSLSRMIRVSLLMFPRSSSVPVAPLGSNFHLSHQTTCANAKACIRSYSRLQIKDPLVNRFTQLRSAGLSIDEAWKVIAVDTLVDAGLLEASDLEGTRILTASKGRQVPVLEAKLVKTIRIEPADDDRIRALVTQANTDPLLSRKDDSSQSSIIRQALRLGLDELERRNSRK